MGWVIRDLRMIWWGRGFGPRGSVIRGPPTTQGALSSLLPLYMTFFKSMCCPM